jgi:phosphatidylglycerol:prolipoprotein diacylglycerol transferase
MPARSLPVHPTQLYSAIHAGLLAWFLWSWYPFRRRDGEVFALLITIYPISRFLLEIIRIDESAVFGTGLSISQNISLALLASAVGLWIYLLRKPAGNLRYRGE